MPSRYEPKKHIQRLEGGPSAEGILDQREITIQSYQTNVAFDYDALDAGLARAWLTPQIRFGVFARSRSDDGDALNVVLGLQGELSVRAYDYDERRPLWFSWQGVIVDTVSIHYSRDEAGLLRFTTTGGGRRITDDRLQDFNSTFLEVPKDAVTKRHFDLAKLRDLCFKRFVDRLYMIRFSDPSGEEYRSIDHALFQSRQYIDPETERMQEVQADAQVKIESFDSDVTILTDDIASPIQVRFFIRGLSGSVRLRFPKVNYKNQLKTPEEQARVFYRLVNATENSILDADYYTQQRRSLDDLKADLDMFPDLVDLAPFREVLTNAEARKEFISGLDIGAQRGEWLPHLHALDELLISAPIATHVAELIDSISGRDYCMTERLLAKCRADPKLYRVGAITARAIAGQLQTAPAAVRPQVEQTLLSWAIDQEQDNWDVDPDTDEVIVSNLRWRVEDLGVDVLPAVIWKLVGVLHDRLVASTGDSSSLLHKFNWCMVAAKALPPNHSKSQAALRLVAADRVPTSVTDGAKVLKEAVGNLRALDTAVLDQFGLPLWPQLEATQTDKGIVLLNSGIGAALAVEVIPTETLFSQDDKRAPFDLLAGDSAAIPISGNPRTVALKLEKFDKRLRVDVPIASEPSAIPVGLSMRALSSISRKRIATQRDYRSKIDPRGVVIGSSPALLKVFEDIYHANAMEDSPAVLILGERGVGKTHIARLIHDSSSRAEAPFKPVNAGGSGGDINIQRGEWIGYGKGHGISGIDPKGKAGHLIEVDSGTLFVDEFVAFSNDLQVIFLSVLEQRDISKVGGETFTPDVRCIFATNADVDELVGRGSLRPDLLARIAARIHIPPLRERRGDIVLLAKHFAGTDHSLSEKCLLALLRHSWPENVRELQNKMVAAIARKTMDGAASVDVAHIDLPAEITAVVQTVSDDDCRCELWRVADQIARDEGFTQGAGLQRRAGEIMGVGEAQASKMYQRYGLADRATA